MDSTTDTINERYHTATADDVPPIYGSLCGRTNDHLLKATILNFNITNLSEECLILSSEVESFRSLLGKSESKVSLLSKLCIDLQKCSSSVHGSIENERARRSELQQSFQTSGSEITKRIDLLASKKQIAREANAALGLELERAVAAYQDFDSQSKASSKADDYFEPESRRLDDAMSSLQESALMASEDYYGRVAASMCVQELLQDEIRRCNVAFESSHMEVTTKSGSFQEYREKIETVSLLLRQNQLRKSSLMSEVGALSKEIKLQRTEYSDAMAAIDKEEKKRANMGKLITALENDITKFLPMLSF
jgi:chromosome segregation ATPase